MKATIPLAKTIPVGSISEQYLVFLIIIVTIGKSLEPKISIGINSLIMSFLAISLIGMKLQIVNNHLKNKILFDPFQNQY
jgi:hypothetical protein